MTFPIEPISGTQYPTLSGKPGITVFENPLFHPNILNVGGANQAINPTFRQDFTTRQGNLHRGLLVSGAGILKGYKSNVQYKVNFLYNPSTITESRSLDLNNGVLPAYARNPDDPGSYATSLNTTISFSLLFDRTFELWDTNYRQTQPGIYGVRSDVEAFYNLLGINIPQTQTNTAAQAKPPAINPAKITNTVQGPMQFIPTYLYFGANSKGALNYFGYVSGINITYTHFIANMTPSRCAIDVSFTVLSQIAGSATGAGSLIGDVVNGLGQ